MDTSIEQIPKGCPVCGSDVYGNDECLFLCRDCFIFFLRKHLKDPEKGDGCHALFVQDG